MKSFPSALLCHIFGKKSGKGKQNHTQKYKKSVVELENPRTFYGNNFGFTHPTKLPLGSILTSHHVQVLLSCTVQGEKGRV